MVKKYIIITLLLVVTVASMLIVKYCKQCVGISSSDVLIVGTNAEYPPFTFIEHDAIVGFDIDLIKEIARRLGKKIELRDMPFTTLLPQLQLGTIHLIAAGMSPTPERAKQALFTKPYLQGSKLVVVMPTAKLPTGPAQIEMLRDKQVVVNEGFVADNYLSEHGIQTRKLPAVADAFMALRSGQADIFVTSDTSVRSFFDQYGTNEFNMSPIPDTAESTALVISKEHPELLEQMQRILDQMQEDGSLRDLKQRWKVGL